MEFDSTLKKNEEMKLDANSILQHKNIQISVFK